ncbi:MAG: AAA family ATPase [Bacteroidaceae bacterium]|nr:AAA family ATPase [Bacteroidaceae bacterium]
MIQHLEKIKYLLQLEYAYEKEQFQRETENMGILRKIYAGLCWFPLRIGRCYNNSLDQLVVEVERTLYTDTDHQFEPGKPVCFFSESSQMLHYMRFTGQVSFVEENRMVIIMPNADAVQQIQDAGQVGVQLYFDEYTYRLMFEALDHVTTAPKGRLAELRDIFHTLAPLQKYTFYPTRFPWLNPSQEAAVNQVLWARDVAVVHGPPGTGKTTTLVEAIYETLHREVQVLVCAQSNMAVDWISQKLTERGVSVLRIGNPTRVTDQMLADTYERRFEAHALYPQLWSIRRSIRQLYSNRQENCESRHQKIARLRDHATELELQIRESIFNDARVIACTLTGSANQLLTGRHFGTLFIDEAAQAMEPACWIAIQKADRVILAGDHRQLPPTIKCPEAMEGGLDCTLMQKIVENKPSAVSLLTVQYRMCDEIMQFPNQEFYEGRLTSAPSVRYRGILDWDTAVEWIDSTPDNIRNTETETDLSGEKEDATSYVNPAEAELTLQTLRNYFDKIGKDRILYERLDVGIISPYQGQIRLLRKMLKHDSYWKPFRSLISVNTVDGFQGQERDIIVISMVRSNERGNVGFLRDLRRMNVAITRARMKLLLIGDSQTLCRHPFYRRLYTYIQKRANFEY